MTVTKVTPEQTTNVELTLGSSYVFSGRVYRRGEVYRCPSKLAEVLLSRLDDYDSPYFRPTDTAHTMEVPEAVGDPLPTHEEIAQDMADTEREIAARIEAEDQQALEAERLASTVSSGAQEGQENPVEAPVEAPAVAGAGEIDTATTPPARNRGKGVPA